MRTRLTRLLSIAVGAAVLLTYGASSARADLLITLQQDSGTKTTVVNGSGSPTDSGGVFGAYGGTSFDNFQILGLSATGDQSPTLSETLGSTLKIKNTDSVAHQLTINIVISGYTQPVTPPILNATSEVGGTVAVGGSDNTLSFTSEVGSNTLATQTPGITSGSFDNTTTSLITSLSAPYSIQQTLVIYLDAGSTINVNTSTTVVPTPAPGGLALLLTGL